MRLWGELKQSGAHLHESKPELLLQASGYEYKTGSGDGIHSCPTNCRDMIARCWTKQPSSTWARCSSVFHSYTVSGSAGYQVVTGTRLLSLCITLLFRQTVNVWLKPGASLPLKIYLELSTILYKNRDSKSYCGWYLIPVFQARIQETSHYLHTSISSLESRSN